MKKPTDEDIADFITSLDDTQLRFVTRLLGAMPEESGSNHSRIFIRGYQEEVRRLFRRPTIDADQTLALPESVSPVSAA